MNETEKEEYEKIELRSNEVQEILTRPPKWIVRWGITIIFFVIAVVLVGSWFFKYPDVVSSPVVVTTKNPPAPIMAKLTGKIQNLLVADKEIVAKDKIIGVIENPANYREVMHLSERLDLFRDQFEKGKIYTFLTRSKELGEIQNSYSSFYKYLQDYNQTLALNYHQKKIDLYQSELNKYALYLNNLETQSNILKEELELTRNQYRRDSVLHAQDLMSESELERSRSSLLNKQYSFEQNNSSLTSTEIQIESLKQSILELSLQKEKQTSDQVNLIWQSYENLLSAIETWRHKYVLLAPTDGMVTFNEFWNENQTVKAGETVVTVIPENEGEIIGKVQLSFQGAGKVKVGQQANIQFANYPHMEFGMVKGEVRSISLAPSNNYYTVEIGMPNGLKTFYDIDLEFKQEMQGVAEIITEDIRLLERIIRPLRYILNKNTKFGNQKE